MCAFCVFEFKTLLRLTLAHSLAPQLCQRTIRPMSFRSFALKHTTTTHEVYGFFAEWLWCADCYLRIITCALASNLNK